MPADRLAERVRADLRAAADPSLAPGMQAYMKSTVPFLGVRVSLVRKLTRAAVRDIPPADLPSMASSAQVLFDEATHREEWYAALALTGLPLARGRFELAPLHAHIASAGAWWDVVDETAHRIADLHDAHPRDTADLVREWSAGDDPWLQRLAILSQLGRRDRVDRELLAELIVPHLPDRNFFIRKAIGWALREYGRVDPAWVVDFVATHADSFSGLSRREALKHLPSGGR